MHAHSPLSFGDLSVATVVSPPPWYENCYVVRSKSSKAALVVDPGGNAPAILDAARADGGTPAAVLLTHGHFDHLGAAHAVQTGLGIGCHAHADERAVIEGAAGLAAAWTGERIQGPDPVAYFDGEPALEMGGIPFRVVHTPGHTPGGVCYVFDGFVLTGDTLFNQGIGRTDLPGGDGPTLMRSITRLLDGLPEDAVLFSGHGPHWTAGEAKDWWRFMQARF